jgi:hypothetical protein
MIGFGRIKTVVIFVQRKNQLKVDKIHLLWFPGVGPIQDIHAITYFNERSLQRSYLENNSIVQVTKKVARRKQHAFLVPLFKKINYE